MDSSESTLYASFGFSRPKKVDTEKTTDVYFNGQRPRERTWWKITKHSSRYIKGGKSDKAKNMRLCLYDGEVSGGLRVPNTWIDADGLRIHIKRTHYDERGINPQYDIDVMPLSSTDGDLNGFPENR